MSTLYSGVSDTPPSDAILESSAPVFIEAFVVVFVFGLSWVLLPIAFRDLLLRSLLLLHSRTTSKRLVNGWETSLPYFLPEDVFPNHVVSFRGISKRIVVSLSRRRPRPSICLGYYWMVNADCIVNAILSLLLFLTILKVWFLSKNAKMSQMYSEISKCIQKCLNVPKNIQNVFKSIQMYSKVSKCTQVYKYIQKYPKYIKKF